MSKEVSIVRSGARGTWALVAFLTLPRPRRTTSLRKLSFKYSAISTSIGAFSRACLQGGRSFTSNRWNEASWANVSWCCRLDSALNVPRKDSWQAVAHPPRLKGRRPEASIVVTSAKCVAQHDRFLQTETCEVCAKSHHGSLSSILTRERAP